MPPKGVNFAKVGIIGVGRVGRGMSLLLLKDGYKVFVVDPDENSVCQLLQDAKVLGLEGSVMIRQSYASLCRSVKAQNEPGVVILSTRGSVSDRVIAELRPHLGHGDTIIDCAFEHLENSGRRQKELEPAGIDYVSCGASGGYHTAKSGPSFSPGGKLDTLAALMPSFRQLAAEENVGRLRASSVPPDISSYYVKMVHNSIEQGMMMVLAEVWFILVRGLGLTYSVAGDIFRNWEKQGLLYNCHLVGVAADILLMTEKSGSNIPGSVRDKVIQDRGGFEGTVRGTRDETVALYVPVTTMVSAHLFQCASAYAAQRNSNEAVVPLSDTRAKQFKSDSQEDLIPLLRKATYFCFLDCFAQGLGVLREKDKAEAWKLNYSNVLQLWRGESNRQENGIINLFDQMYARPDHDPDNILTNRELATEMLRHLLSAKEVVVKAVMADLSVPAISQSLEHYKFSNSAHLPAQFREVQLNYFGQHSFGI